LRITPGEQRTWRDPRRAYKAWRTAIEARGVLTFQIIGVPPAEVLGFSFACEELSVIGVNQKVRPNGRIFTLLHELVHVVLSYSSLCDLEEEAPRPAQEQEVEVFCNAVAAAALVPRQTLLENDLIRARGAGHHEWSNEELEAVARSFAVSEEVILRRLVFTDRASQAFYRAKRMEYLARYARLETEEREAAAEQEMRRNMPREALSNLGSSYTRLVLDSFNQDQITLTDASRYLGLKAKHIAKLEDLALAE
jgi:Zn-dependent peptidase ImmA (M78 family)